MLLTLIASLLILNVPLAGLGPALPWHWTLLGVGALVGVNALACWTGMRMAGHVYNPETGAGQMQAVRIVKVLHAGVVALVAVDVFALRWPLFVGSLFRRHPYLPLVDDLVLLAPALLMILTAMVFKYGLECSRGRVGIGLARYLLLRVRTELAILLVPWLVVVAVADLLDASDLGPLGGVLSMGLIVAIFVFGPWLLRYLWRTSPLPPGPLRDRLEAFSRKSGFRCREILVWHTYNHLPNAAVVGVVPGTRYVLITDALLCSCTDEEIEGVFAHEAGHVRRHHVALYAVFAVGFLCLCTAAADLLVAVGLIAPLESVLSADMTVQQGLLVLAFALFYWVVAFGFLSRRLEQEADVYSLSTASDPAAFLRALQKLSAVSGMPARAGSWRHFSVAHRTRFLAGLLGRPDRARLARRGTWLLKSAVVGLCVVAGLYLLARHT